MIVQTYTKLSPIGDQAIRIEFGSEIRLDVYHRIQLFMKLFNEAPVDFVQEMMPSFTTVTIMYDANALIKSMKKEQYGMKLNPYEWMKIQIEKLLAQTIQQQKEEKIVIDIPVCYEAPYSPDLEYVATYNQLTTDEVIALHSEREYLVYMLGFAPGFPYLGGINPKISTPRKPTPILKVEAGSIGIAGEQTGIYSIETPGGWQIIGRTPLALFQPEKENPTLLRAGVWIRFKSITAKQFDEMKGNLQCQLPV